MKGLEEHPTMWQRVIHGSALELRREVSKVLRSQAGKKRADRYLMCGLADKLVRKDGGVHVAPRGCGDKLCPRCGRKRGGRYARRIMMWLGHEAHGDLWSVCLTQKIIHGEGLKAARDRMAPKQRAYMRWLTTRGLIGAMTTNHAVWSTRMEAWHYHVHIFVELPEGVEHVAGLLHKWTAIDPGAYVDPEGGQCRLVLAAGPAVAELVADGGSPDFWNESPSDVARAIQYPIRDMAQGVSAWRLGGDTEGLRRCATELVAETRGWKMFRTWGRWRKAHVPKPSEPKEEAKDGASPPPATPPVSLGTVGRVWVKARRGDPDAQAAFRLLEASCRNQSEFGKRLLSYCRMALVASG